MKLLKLVPDNTNIDFMRWRNVALVLQIVLMVAALTLVAVKGLNLGIDFVGGQVVRTTFAQPINVEQLRDRVNALELGDASIQEFGGPRSYQIRLPKPEGGDAAASRAVTQVRAMINESYPDARVDAGESVSGKVSEELAFDGAIAVALSMLGIAIYIWLRFEWQFGVGALATLTHDVCMIFGFFALTQMQVDLNIVAAFLAIVGYSLNDTVVIFDRIRENFGLYTGKSKSEIINMSLNSTMSRTLITSLTVFLVVLALFFFGGASIKGFAFALVVGLISGTYSTIFIAAPVLVDLSGDIKPKDGVTHSFKKTAEIK